MEQYPKIMKNIVLILLLIFTNQVLSQKKIVKLNESETLTIDDDQTGKVENGVFVCNKFDWQIKIPQNYNVSDAAKLKQQEERGNAELKKNINGETKIQNPTHLIAFEKNSKNIFSAGFTPLSDSKLSLENHKQTILNLLKENFSKIKNARFEYTNSNVEIGNHHFYKIKVEGYNESSQQLVITQIYYNGFIKNNLFGVLISYDNEADGKMLENNFLASFK
jgi:hypothetical protein